MSKIDELLAKSAAAGARLQRIANQMSDRAALQSIYGIRNEELDKRIADNHIQALQDLLEIGDKLEQAAIAAGLIKKEP